MVCQKEERAYLRDLIKAHGRKPVRGERLRCFFSGLFPFLAGFFIYVPLALLYAYLYTDMDFKLFGILDGSFSAQDVVCSICAYASLVLLLIHAFRTVLFVLAFGMAARVLDARAVDWNGSGRCILIRRMMAFGEEWECRISVAARTWNRILMSGGCFILFDSPFSEGCFVLPVTPIMPKSLKRRAGRRNSS